VADHVRRSGITPALVLCSTARRATETLDAVMPAFARAPEVRVEKALYGASDHALVHRLREVAPTIPSVMLIGHNPSIQSVALVLVGEGDATLIAALRHKMPTGALATLELEGEWSTMAAGTARLHSFVVPRDLS
jgi:phosphohistidine phosphatase